MGKVLHKLPSAVISDPQIMGGTPVIRGTRVPAELIAMLVREGVPTLEILEDYPTIDLDDIQAVVEWAAKQSTEAK